MSAPGPLTHAELDAKVKSLRSVGGVYEDLAVIVEHYERPRCVTTPTGIPIITCAACGRSHPETRDHCLLCGHASLFLNGSRLCVPCAAVAS
jgi:hypothetical protein